MSGTNGGYATKDLILSVKDLKSEDVFVEEWGATVRVQELRGSERGAFEASLSNISAKGDAQPDIRNMRVRLCAMCIVDESGNRLFNDTELGKLGSKSARALQTVYEVAARLSGVSDDSVEEAVGESEAIPQDESSSLSA
ncbi:MAG: hypothetical protein CL793_07805 [Chloroflexi bacterium]|nr:hypothetical protein [Chloroflexota bacterium]|tara:strand:+ start:2948 stop:3367 length:420 start_codon:yes stop_codon:yes gene_type:complete